MLQRGKAWVAAARGGHVPLMNLLERFPSVQRDLKILAPNAAAGARASLAWLGCVRTHDTTILTHTTTHSLNANTTLRNPQSSSLTTPLYHVHSRPPLEAAFGGQPKLLNDLLARFRLEASQECWERVLSEAAAGGHAQIVELALQKGATNVNKCVSCGELRREHTLHTHRTRTANAPHTTHAQTRTTHRT